MTVKTTTRFAIPFPGTDENVDVPADLEAGFTKVDDALSGLADGITRVEQGVSSTTGRSAYQDAVARGFVGTLDEWLASLQGKAAYQSWLDQGNEGTEADFLAWLQGADGNPGPAPQFTVTSTTLPPGSAATVGVTGISPELALEFGIPQGDPGDAGATDLDGLTDVDLTTAPPLEGEILVRRGAQFVPESPPSVPTILDALNDVTAGSPAGGQVLTYNATTGQWEAAAPSGGTGGATTFDALTDVNVAAATDGQVPVLRAGTWVPETPASGGGGATTLEALTDVTTTGATAGQVLTLGSDGQWKGATPTAGGTTGEAVATAGASMHRAGTAGAITGTGYRTLVFDTVGRIDAGFAASTTAGTITVPAAGWYSAHAHVRLTVSSNTTHLLAISKADGTGYVLRGDQTIGNIAEVTLGGVFWAEAGTALCAQYFSATTTSLVGGDPTYTSFSVVALGAGAVANAGALNDLSDVDTITAAPAEGQVLTYRNGQWVADAVQQPQAPATDVQGVLVIPLGGVVPTDTPEGTLIFERNT